MGLFNQRKPRPFRHRYMFVDERKERIRDIEEKAKAELGMKADGRQKHERIQGMFFNATRHVRKRRERKLAGGFVLTYGVIVVLLIMLFAIWKILLTM